MEMVWIKGSTYGSSHSSPSRSPTATSSLPQQTEGDEVVPFHHPQQADADYTHLHCHTYNLSRSWPCQVSRDIRGSYPYYLDQAGDHTVSWHQRSCRMRLGDADDGE